MNMYDKKSVCCSQCDRFIGEIDEDAVIVLPKCGKCANPFPEGDDKVQYFASKMTPNKGNTGLSLQILKVNDMSKQRYRSEMGIIADILGVTMDGGTQGVIVSAISRRANLSHYAVLEKCQKLIDAGLVESMKSERNRLFRVTEKGIQFFHEMQKFIAITQEAKIQY